MTIKLAHEEVRKIINKYGYNLLDDYINNHEHFVDFVDSNGYKYHSILYSFIKIIKSKGNFNGARFKNSNIFILDNIKNWLLIKNKNFYLVSKEYYGAQKRLIFHCNKCDHDFKETWNHLLSNNAECSYCKSLPFLFPKLIEEWDYIKNEKSPEEYSYSSNKLVYWVCKNGHEWEMSINSRTNMGTTCPHCKKLPFLFPEISKEWDYIKNDKFPEEYTANSNEAVWWICECGHSWKAVISSRTTGAGCPECKESHGEKRIRKFLIKNKICFIPQKKFEDCKYKRCLEFDFYVETDYGFILIEYDGIQHFKPINCFGGQEGFKKTCRNDIIKNKYCKDKNIPFYRIPYTKFNNIENILSEIFNL